MYTSSTTGGDKTMYFSLCQDFGALGEDTDTCTAGAQDLFAVLDNNNECFDYSTKKHSSMKGKTYSSSATDNEDTFAIKYVYDDN